MPKERNTIKINLMNITMYVIVVLIVSGGIFFIMEKITGTTWASLIFSYFIGVATLALTASKYLKSMKTREKKLTGKIMEMGAGRLNQISSSNKTDIFPEITKSIELADQKLTERFRSIEKNARRLSYLEEKLSSRFRNGSEYDKSTRDLVCQLKICTSRLKNDLNDFYISEISHSE
ncbi:MAG: hypothetical protein ABIJ45_03930 [Candidatus Zixiibacteriota bacterium]